MYIPLNNTLPEVAGPSLKTLVAGNPPIRSRSSLRKMKLLRPGAGIFPPPVIEVTIVSEPRRTDLRGNNIPLPVPYFAWSWSMPVVDDRTSIKRFGTIVVGGSFPDKGTIISLFRMDPDMEENATESPKRGK